DPGGAGAVGPGRRARSGGHARRHARPQARSGRMARDLRVLRQARDGGGRPERGGRRGRFVGGRRRRGEGGRPVHRLPGPAGRSRPLARESRRTPGRPSAAPGLARPAAQRAALTVELFGEPERGGGAPGAPGGGRAAAPLADRMRPRTLDEIVGQEHLLGQGRVLRAAIETGELHSMILWGPPGTGKTTLASLMASVTGARFVAFSAVLSGVQEIREVIAEADRERARRGIRTILFVDEIHRFNRAQQDAFLPHVEKGTVVLVGATTENPSFEVNSALLSRCRVYVLRALEDDDLLAIMRRALADGARGLASLRPEVSDDGLRSIARVANGDARVALNVLEVAVALTPAGGGPRRVTEASI